MRTRARPRRRASRASPTASSTLAARERDTLIPDYTYLQVAQPTTAGHWLLSFAYPALRDLERLAATSRGSTAAPAGAGGVNGSRFPLDRGALSPSCSASTRPSTHTRDAMWQTDGLSEAVSHAAIAATGQPLRRGPRALRERRVRPAADRRRAVPGERADAAEAQPVRARGAARRRRHADRPRHRACSRPSARPRAGPTTCSTPTASSAGRRARDAPLAARRRARRASRSTASEPPARARGLRAGHRRRRGDQPEHRPRLPLGLRRGRPRRRRAGRSTLDRARAPRGLGGSTTGALPRSTRARMATRTVPGGAAPGADGRHAARVPRRPSSRAAARWRGAPRSPRPRAEAL